MLALRQKQTIPTLGPAEGPDVDDPSIMQSVMPHQVPEDEEGADADDHAHPCRLQLTEPMYLTWIQPRLGKSEYQAWF